ncbi:RagB/SusD family nutrient uptake outer membrane protein [Avrilella dinanensis]|uniref:RagB/SusD domain-containing protein n=1 Tax=Avrilella dinanensis TaxID=2008672 RepID=A0A2M9R3F3_9FLAO|nr:RagB/SusD family nutrient uptake outer membrane protein [Avrilella dinanensis]PJR03389.1 hypothetical protein CDL10_01850 [Avrilella dinanensis]
MKNKFIAILSGLALITATTSCEDAHNVEQPGYDNSTDDTKVFRNNTDIERGILGLHASLSIEGEIEFVSYFTDELGIGVDNGGQGINDGSWRFFMDPGNDFASSAWSRYYNVINRVNRLLHRIDELKAETTDSAESAAYDLNRARLLTIRAYSNLKLFSYYTPDYTDMSGLSIIKFNFYHTDDYNRHEARATVGEIVEFIEEDAEEALTTIGNGMDTFRGVTDNAYVSQNLARAVLVKLYAMIERPVELLHYADEITGKSLATNVQYLVMYDGNTPKSDLIGNPEIIFRLNRTYGDGNRVAAAWYESSTNVTVDGYANMEIGRTLFNRLDALGSASDLRYAVNVSSHSDPQPNYASLPYQTFKTRDLLYIGKYTGNDQDPLQNDIMVMRYADILLAKAEAYAMQGNVQGVEDIITEIREARSVNLSAVVLPTITNVQSAWKAILEERQVEFAFEGHRYLDVKRLGRKAGLTSFFTRDSKDCEEYNVCEIPSSDEYKLTLPIPRSETQSNPVIREQQNPGY